MRTIAFYSFVLIGIIITLTAAGYLATNTATAASPLASIVVAHEPMQTVVQTVQDAEQKATTTPTAPTTATPPASTPAPAVVPENTTPTTPVLLSIPSINLSAPIIQVGLNDKGEMDVPNGNTNNVGWYNGGTVPGNDGSAVLDAHVFAALKNLRYAKVGDSVYVKDAHGVTRHFVIRSSMVYALADVPREQLFNRTDGKYLNIITCAGQFDQSINTYDHRLIDYAELVSD